MRTFGRISNALLAATIAVATPFLHARAQDTARSPLTYSAELAQRGWIHHLAPAQLGKFLEYKAVPSGVFVQNLFVRYEPDGFRKYEVSGTNIGQRDQALRARATQPGKFDAQFSWDDVPHTFSTTAHVLDTRPTPDVFVLPNPRPDTATWNRSGFAAPVQDLWRPVKLSLAYNLVPNADSKLEFLHISRTGDRPLSMSFGNSPSLAQREVMEPVDETITNVNVSQNYSFSRFTFMAGYNVSMFDNRYAGLTADNPTLITDTPAAGSSRGRLSLPPTNMAQTASAAAAVALPRSTRITVNGSYSMWHQDAKFLPATINTAIVDPRLDSLPKSLGAKAGTTNLSITASTRPIQSVTVTAHARSFEFRDESDARKVLAFVLNDRVLSGADSTVRNPISRTNADVKVVWRALRFASVYGAMAHDRQGFDNPESNVENYVENTPSVGVDVMGNQWVTVRGSYAVGHRRMGGAYDTLGYMPQFRRFYLADRDRTRFTLTSSVTPLDQITLSGTWSVGHDEYVNTAYGVQYDRNGMVGGDIDWTPSRSVALSGGMTFENSKNHMKDRYRTGAQVLNTTYDWIADNNDVDHMAYAAAEVEFIPDKLTGTATIQKSIARFRLMTYNPATPTGGTASNKLGATAADFPMVKQLLQMAGIGVSYRVRAQWLVTARVQGELYSQDDFRSDNLKPATANQYFLGNYFQDYNAQYITFSVTYRPQAPRGVRSTF